MNDRIRITHLEDLKFCKQVGLIEMCQSNLDIRWARQGGGNGKGA